MKSSTRNRFKFKPKDPVLYDGKKAYVVTSWYDGHENRCQILVTSRDSKGEYLVREASLVLDESRIKE